MQLSSLPKINNICTDSRKVKPGDLFCAIKGSVFDGHEFIDNVIANGAAAIIGEQELKLPIPYFKSDNIRRDLALLAAEFFVKQPREIAAVTGTNGKTSVADFARQLWEMEEKDCASIGTLGMVHNGENVKLDGDNTSPDPITLHSNLAKISDAAVIEASSIGLEQHRLDGVKVSAAAFTNFSHDHLDYHKTMDEYFRCKTLLFDILQPEGFALIHSSIKDFPIKQRKIIYGDMGDLQIISAAPLPNGQIIKLKIFDEIIEFQSNLIGKFQAENILCAAGLTGNHSNLDKLKPVPGRMEQAASGVYIDYAHTPDALENALRSISPHTDGRIILVFGCGGDRDISKRGEMGKIANELAHIVIITDDNPRTEDAASIRKEIISQCPKANEISDRKDAINEALNIQQSGDIVLIAGKGHEKYQIIGNEKHYFDDFQTVRDIKL